jgi:AcrR family transcriptional regulator
MKTRTASEDGSLPLARDRIVEAALGIVDRRGVDALSMRRLARALDVAPMSLYRHVRDKQELLALLAEAVAERLPHKPSPDGWRATIVDVLSGVRRLLAAHPGIGAFLGNDALRTPTALNTIEVILAALHEGGLEDGEAARLFSALWTFTLGSVVVEESPAVGFPTAELDLAARQRLAAELGDSRSRPRVAAASSHWLALDPEESFRAGVDALLAGVGRPESAAGAQEGGGSSSP